MTATTRSACPARQPARRAQPPAIGASHLVTPRRGYHAPRHLRGRSTGCVHYAGWSRVALTCRARSEEVCRSRASPVARFCATDHAASRYTIMLGDSEAPCTFAPRMKTSIIFSVASNNWRASSCRLVDLLGARTAAKTAGGLASLGWMSGRRTRRGADSPTLPRRSALRLAAQHNVRCIQVLRLFRWYRLALRQFWSAAYNPTPHRARPSNITVPFTRIAWPGWFNNEETP